MAWCLRHCLVYVGAFNLLIACLNAQTISTNTPVPPLQWINLTGLLQGPPAPPLKDASIGYDETSRSLLIFGGESAQGFPQSQTFLLNLSSLTWMVPSPPSYLPNTPPARSAALSGDDFAASNRHGHVIIGGKGTDGKPLSDVWEFDYINQFWAPVVVSPGGPSARWGASGGIDIRTAPVQDAVVPGPNNTIYLAGGFDGITPSTLSDIWEFHISGTLSSNLPNSVNGSWQPSPIGNLPPKIDQAGTVLGQQIVTAGGCNTSSVLNDSCAQQDSYVLNMQRNTVISPVGCPAPRLSPSLAPNVNAFSPSFATQVFSLLGTFNTSLWQDGGGLEKGEVDILDISTGTWSRVLPSGDPGSSETPAFPGPREGASTLSYSSALVGQSRSSASDTIVFGGRDAGGQYLSEVWILRAYNGMINGQNQTWTGFGDGQLQTGVNSNGAGVTVQYLASCASAVNVTGPSGTTGGSPTTPSPVSTSPSYSRSQLYDTSSTHKWLAPLSIALLFPALALVRLGLSPAHPSNSSRRRTAFLYAAASMVLISYGIGIGGLVTSFTSITVMSSSLVKRSTADVTLQTGHGKAGLILFAGLYGVLPLVFLFSLFSTRSRSATIVDEKTEEPDTRVNSHDASERPLVASTVPSVGHPTPPATPRPRHHSWGPSSWPGHRRGEDMTDDESVTSRGAHRGFEVVNRPARVRHSSVNGLIGSEFSHMQRMPVTPRSLGDVSWLERRRSLNAVGELDYVMSQATRAQALSTPVTNDVLSTRALMTTPILAGRHLEMPPSFDIILRLSFHALLLGLCALSLVALWYHPSRAGFAVFLVWVVVFYLSLAIFAWHGRPQKSVLSVMFARLRADQRSLPSVPTATPSPRALSTIGLDQYPFPTDSRGPYIHHQPPYRATLSAGHDDASTSYGGPRSVETDDDEDEDEDTRQRRMEEEMGRRDVSIVTVPKRKLWVTNN